MAKILLVDDSLLHRSMVKDALLQSGHEIVGEVADGEKVRSSVQETQPDVVILDIILPGIIGLDILKTLNAEFPKIKVIINSVLEDPTIKNEAFQSGAIAYLSKPFTVENLKAALAKI